MKTIKTMVDAETYSMLVRERRRLRLPSVSALFLKKCGVLTDVDEAREIVEAARRKIARLDEGGRFTLRELFQDEQWEGFAKGARLRAGRLFHEYAAEEAHGIVILEEKTSANHQMYKKR